MVMLIEMEGEHREDVHRADGELDDTRGREQRRRAHPDERIVLEGLESLDIDLPHKLSVSRRAQPHY